MSPKEPTCLAGKQCHSPADLAHGQGPAQRLVGVRRKPERPVPFHLELAPCRWTAAADESQPPGLGSNDKWVQLGNAEACRLHQSIRSRMKKPRWKESQNFFERRTLMHHQDWKRFFHKKLADRHNLLLKLKILLHQLVLCSGQSLRSFCSNSFCGKTQGNCRTGPGGGGTHFNTRSFPPRKLPLSHDPPVFLTKVLSSA